MAVSYEAQVERRAGQNYMVIKRTVTITPKSGRGREWSKQEREHQIQVLPLLEVSDLMTALSNGFLFAVPDPAGHPDESGPTDLGTEPSYLLRDTADSEPMPFWSYDEAMAHVFEMRREGRHTKGWRISRIEADGSEDMLNVVQA